MLTVRLTPEGPGEVVADARVLDLRKRGVVPLAGLVNGPGVVHDMQARLVLGRQNIDVRSAELTMAAVPFPPTQGTGGESCRDNEAPFARLIGTTLGRGFLPRLHRVIGGPRGCFHVFTLMRLVAPSMVWATERGLQRDTGRAFVRTVIVDGFQVGTSLHLHGTLSDLWYAGNGVEELAGAFEGEAEARVELPSLQVQGIEGRYRRRGAQGPPERWSSEGLDALSRLGGTSLARGYSIEVDRVLPGKDDLAPMRELLLMLQPVAFQCMPSLAEEHGVARTARRSGPIAAVDSCSMWRREGPLLATALGEIDAAPH